MKNVACYYIHSSIQLTTPENTITYHNALCFTPKFCISIVFNFSWELTRPQERLKTMLLQNFGVTNKEHYGVLWFFLEWSIARPSFLPSVPRTLIRLQYFSFPNRPANNRDVIRLSDLSYMHETRRDVHRERKERNDR